MVLKFNNNCCLLYRWSTHWFQLVMDIPEGWRGEEVHLRWNSGSEAMVHNVFNLVACQ